MWNKFSKLLRPSKKVVVIGIDGVPYTLLNRLIQDGTMPNLAKIVDEGTLAPMDSSLPEVSSVAWSSFMTGTNPGQHGIYGFMELQPGTYKMYFPNFKHLKKPPLWEIVGRRGKRCVVLNLPSTYPAQEINGILCAGFVALDLKKATYPASAYHYLDSIGYRIDVDSNKARQSMDYLLEDLTLTLEKRRQAFLHFFDNEQWDLFIGVVTETDRLHHFLWEAIEDENHKYHPAFKQFYRSLDELIGQIYERSAGTSSKSKYSFLLLSDHGFTRVKQEVYLNNWLKEKGYLHFAKTPPQSLEDIAEESRAFALDPSRIYINLKGKYAKGSINPGKEYESLRDKLSEELADWRVIKQIWRKEEVYRGPQLDNAPDLVLLPHEGYDLKGSIKKDSLMGKDIFTGMHTHSNALFFINQKDILTDRLNITDPAATILHLMGHEPVPPMEGKIIAKT